MKKTSLFVLGLAAIVIGIIGLAFLEMFPASIGSTSITSSDTFSSVGERIYFTGVGNDGPIPLRGGPPWLGMRGGGCAACHGSDGQGGLAIMMSNKVAPAISFKALIEEEEEDPPWNEKLIKRAITDGIDPAGKPLDSTMPRWGMSDEDLNEIIKFLKTLD